VVVVGKMMVGGIVREFAWWLVVVTVAGAKSMSGREGIDLESEAGWAYSDLEMCLTGGLLGSLGLLINVIG